MQACVSHCVTQATKKRLFGLWLHILPNLTSAMATPLPNVVDLQHCDDPPSTVWDEKEWIHIGKKYPMSDIPIFIQKAQSHILAMPPECAAYILNRQLSITEFLQMPLPSQAWVLVSQMGSSSFSDKLPNEDLAHIREQSIPPKSWIFDLEKDFGQAWFNKKQLIKDFRFKDS